MTARALPRRVARPHDATAVAVAAIAGSVAAGWLVVEVWPIRVLIAAAAICFLVGLGATAPRALLIATVVWLTALGLVRRLVSELTPVGSADPLLIVGATALVVLAAVAVHRGALHRPTTLSKAVVVLSGLIFVGALNPLQGSMLGGVAGLLFVFIPTLGFWIGRGLCDDRLTGQVLKVVGLLAVPVAVYGLVQVLHGFPSWDASWIRESGYAALILYTDSVTSQGAYRPFGSFASASEYGVFLAIAIVVWLAFWRRPATIALSGAAVALFGAALLFQSSRGVVVALVIALGLMASAWRRFPFSVSIAASATLLVLLPIVAGRLPWTGGTGSPTAELLTHQVEGLSNPLDPGKSTLLSHLSLIGNGLSSAFTEPLGLGISAVTIAGERFGGLAVGTEADPSNVAVALGLPGLIAFVVVFILGFRRTYELAAGRRDAVALAGLGVVAVTVFQWLNGGHYAVAILPWLILGWVDRTLSRERDTGRVADVAAPGAGLSR